MSPAHGLLHNSLVPKESQVCLMVDIKMTFAYISTTRKQPEVLKYKAFSNPGTLICNR